jgi:uncharacterized protein (TIGR02231 family)
VDLKVRRIFDMRTLFLVGLTVSSALVPAASWAADIEAVGALKSATVYTDRAALNRVASVNVPAGKHVIVFKGLSTQLMPDSLRAEGAGDAKVILGALSHKIVHQTALVNEKELVLNKVLEGLQTQKRIVGAERDVLNSQEKFYKSLAAQTVASVNEEISVYEFNTAKWDEAAKVVAKGLSDAALARVAFDAQIQDLDAQVRKVRAEINQVRTGQKQTYEVRIPVDAAKATRLSVDLSYQIPGARWTPVYDARLDTKSGGLQMVQYGSVSQRTGEDWSDIELTLSTARPHRGAGVPDLSPMWVNLQQEYVQARGGANFPVVSSRNVKKSSMADMKMMDEAVEELAAPMPMIAAAPVAARIDTGGFTAEYIIPGPSSVASDGSAAKVYIGDFAMDNKMQVHIKPQMGNDAYLVAKATLKGDAPILPGQVSLFRDGAFVGQSYAKLLRPGKASTLSFGIDDQIEVKRNVLKDERGQSGMFVSKSDLIERHYVTSVTNLRGSAVDIVVDESVPVSKDEQIQAKVLADATSAGYSADADNVKGLLRWNYTLEPKASKDVKLGWSVAWPQDREITGVR